MFVLSCKKEIPPSTVIPPPQNTSKTFYRGADLSFLPEIEQAGTVFYNGGTAASVLDILKNNGCNLVRVRLWHHPLNEHSGLDEVLDFCKRIHDRGMQILLDFHYSDTWADPAHQSTPSSWASADFTGLQDSVYNYTQRVINLLIAQNTLPAIVQIGNEINNGFLWNTGKVSSNTDPNWINFVTLLNKAIAAVKSVDANNQISIMLHYAGIDGAIYFFRTIQHNVAFDMIGISYYPWWHGKDLNTVQQQLNSLTSLNKKIMIVETAYPFTLQWKDQTQNVVGTSEELINGYDATPDGQLAYLIKLRTIISSVSNNLGIGFCYWAPDWVAFKVATSTDGSSWENLALFDFSNNALPALQAYHE